MFLCAVCCVEAGTLQCRSCSGTVSGASVSCGWIIRVVVRDCQGETSGVGYGGDTCGRGLPDDFEHTVREHEEAHEKDC